MKQMEWVKASERLPEVELSFSNDPGVIFRKISRSNVFMVHTSVRTFSFMGDKDEWEWLSESASSKQATPVDGYWKERCEAAEKVLLTKDPPKNKASKDNNQFLLFREAYGEWQDIVSKREGYF